MIPTTGHDVRKRQVDSFSRPSASLPVSPRPERPSVGRREGGGKVAALPPPCGPWGSPRAAARCSPERGQGCAGSALPGMLAGLPEDRQGSLELIRTSGQRFCFHASPQDCKGTSTPRCDHRRPELRAERGPGAPPVTPVVGPAEVIADRVDKLPGEGPPASVGRPRAVLHQLAVNEALHQLGGVGDPLSKTAVATQIGKLKDELSIRGKQ
jgi:hypothetical protein